MQYKNEEYNPILHDKFKALSVKQPYAEYIASGIKCVEVRSKPTKYRGQLLICASKSGQPEENTSGFGCCLAFVELYDCKPFAELTPNDWESTRLPGDVIESLIKSDNGFGWFLRNPQRVIEFPVKGQLGIFNLVYTKGVIIRYPTHLDFPIIE